MAWQNFPDNSLATESRGSFGPAGGCKNVTADSISLGDHSERYAIFAHFWTNSMTASWSAELYFKSGRKCRSLANNLTRLSPMGDNLVKIRPSLAKRSA